jgi:hypothetical protein
MLQPELKAVPESDILGAVDSWTSPTDLPNDTLMSPRRFLGERFWKFDPDKIILIPMPALAVRITLLDYINYPVLVHNHRKWMLENQDQIPESYRPFEIYFPSDTYLHHLEDRTAENICHIYRITFKDNGWSEDEVSINHIPLKSKDGSIQCRIIMMR